MYEKEKRIIKRQWRAVKEEGMKRNKKKKIGKKRMTTEKRRRLM